MRSPEFLQGMKQMLEQGIAFRKMTTEMMTKAHHDLQSASREDVDEVVTILKEIGGELRQDQEFAPDILEDLEVLGVNEFASSQVTIKIRMKTAPIKQWRIGREFRRRIKKAFDAHGIEIPFPHVTLYLGESKEGNAPPLRVALDSRSSLGAVDGQDRGEKEYL